jgi:hypothetical protein
VNGIPSNNLPAIRSCLNRQGKEPFYPLKQVGLSFCGSGISPRLDRGWKPLPPHLNLFDEKTLTQLAFNAKPFLTAVKVFSAKTR